jgi:hypothetical protein
MELMILIPVGAYLLIGLWSSISVDFEDLRRRRISVPGGLSLASGIHPVLFFVWPAWYFPYRESVNKGKPEVIIAYGEGAKDYFDESKRIPETEPIEKPVFDELKATYLDSTEVRKLAELTRLIGESKDPNQSRENSGRSH